MKTIYFKSWLSPIAGKDGIKRWFPRFIKKKKAVTTVQLARKVSEKCTVTVGDCFNVIYSFFSTVGEELMDGYSVKIDGFGTFTAIANAQGQGVESAKEVNASQIAGIRIRFTPEYTYSKFNGTTRSMFEGVRFERIDKDTNDDGDNDGNGGGDLEDPDA